MKSVLIVDDEAEIRSVFEEIFRYEYDFENIAFAKDGREALHQCSLQKFDIISLDHNMPIMKGSEFLSKLRSTPGINQQTPVIMISAHLPELEEHIKKLPNTFFMDKPVDFKYLGELVEKFAPNS